MLELGGFRAELIRDGDRGDGRLWEERACEIRVYRPEHLVRFLLFEVVSKWRDS